MSTLVSLDLDDLGCYFGIHGLDQPEPDSDPDSDSQSLPRRGLALEHWLPRFLDVFEATKTRATIFVIGSDLEYDLAERGGRGAEQLVRAMGQGHELANHSHAHAYDFHRLPPAQIAEDIARCDALLRSLGARPRGFRAPGYTHDATMLMQVAALGYGYDSSVLPSPTYFAAKLGILGLRRLQGRRSVSQATGLRAFLAPTNVHYLPEVGLWEVPVSVSRGLRLPLTGTFLLGDAPPMLTRLQAESLRREAARKAHLHVELHAIDLADPEADGIDPRIVAAQRELATPLSRRIERLGELLNTRGGGLSIGRMMARHMR